MMLRGILDECQECIQKEKYYDDIIDEITYIIDFGHTLLPLLTDAEFENRFRKILNYFDVAEYDLDDFEAHANEFRAFLNELEATAPSTKLEMLYAAECEKQKTRKKAVVLPNKQFHRETLKRAAASLGVDDFDSIEDETDVQVQQFKKRRRSNHY
jgi:hypothetical protein